MADIFTRKDAQKLLRKKNLWLFGDSNMRGLYKDLIWLLEKNTLIELSSLRGKLERSFMNDSLIKGGTLHRGRNFQEIRHYKNFTLQTTIEFTFLTQCLSRDIQQRLKDAQKGKALPDVVLMNSCLWDITRWGPESVEKYKEHIVELLQLLKTSLPSKSRVIWTTTPPISNEPHGGFFIKQIEFLKHTLRFEVMEANAFVSKAVIQSGFDVLDIHYHLLLQIHRRCPDGIHWTPEAMRHITNLFLTHISASWGIPLPANFKSPLLEEMHLDLDCKLSENDEVKTEETSMPIEKALEDIKNVNTRRPSKRRGKKRDFNGNLMGRNEKEYFANDVFDYDYRRKRFRLRDRKM